MKNCLTKVLLIVGLIAISSFAQTPTTTPSGLNFNPLATLNTPTLITTGCQQHPTQPKWFYTVKSNTNDKTFRVMKFDSSQSSRISQVSKLSIPGKTDATIPNAKFISPDLSCALVKTDTDMFDVYDFTTATASLKGSSLSNSASANDLDNTDIKSLTSSQMGISQVGNKCMALKINIDFYAWQAANSKFTKATAPQGTTLALSDDLMFAASSTAGL